MRGRGRRFCCPICRLNNGVSTFRGHVSKITINVTNRTSCRESTGVPSVRLAVWKIAKARSASKARFYGGLWSRQLNAANGCNFRKFPVEMLMCLRRLKMTSPLWLMALLLSVAGCTEGEVASHSNRPAAPTPVPASHTAGSTTTELVATEAISEDPVDGDAELATTTAEEFRPPFPGRTELFRVDGDERATARVVRQQATDVADIQLKGFINVDRPRAILQVDGKVWIAHEGDVRDELTVVRVSPPNVTVTRHGERVELSIHGVQ